MKPEDYSGHPLYTEYRPVSNKEAAIGIICGVLVFFAGFIYFMGKGNGTW